MNIVCIKPYNIGFSSGVILFFCMRVVVFCRLSSVTLHCTPTIPHRLDEAKQ